MTALPAPAAVPATLPGQAAGYKLASVLLQYPTRAVFDGLGELDAAAKGGPRAARGHLAAFLAWLRATPPHEVAQHYVETFDLRRRARPPRSRARPAGSRAVRPRPAPARPRGRPS